MGDIVPLHPPQPERLTPASMRLLGTAVGDLAESLGGALTTVPSIGPAYLPDGKASICLVLTVSVAALNEYAAEDELHGQVLVGGRDRIVFMAVSDEWQTAEAIGVACDLGYVVPELRALFEVGLVERSGSMWRRKQ